MRRVLPLLPQGAAILDVGCGTGHNGEHLRHRACGTVTEVDIVDFSVVGPRPTLFDGRHLPFEDRQFDTVTLIYVLHYARDPVALLREAQRVCRSGVIVIQTVCEGSMGASSHCANEFLSRLGFHAARALHAIPPVGCPLGSARHLSRVELLEMARQAGLAPRELRTERHVHLPALTRITGRLEPLGLTTRRHAGD
jgi:SAM-dependent methyltransferase